MLGSEKTLRKRVLVLTTTFPRWEGDATPAFVYELCLELLERFDVNVMAPHHGDAKHYEEMHGIKVYRFPYFYPARYQRLCYEGGIMANIKSSLLAKIQAPLFIISAIYHSLKICKKENVDIVHSHWIIPSGLAGAVCCRILGKKHFLTMHTNTFALERFPFHTAIARFIANNSCHITATSAQVIESLLSLLPLNMTPDVQRKSSILPMGVSMELFSNKGNKDQLKAEYGFQSRYVILFIGRLVEKKGVSYLLEAMSLIAAKDKDIMLVICGDGPLRFELEKKTEELRIEKYVTFAGHSSGKKKLDYLALSDIMVAPSITAESGDAEGLPVAVMEGLASGKPLIATDADGIRDMVKDGWNGFLVREKDPGQLAAKVLEIMQGKDLSLTFSRNALQTGSEYGWNTVGEKYGSLLSDIAESMSSCQCQQNKG